MALRVHTREHLIVFSYTYAIFKGFCALVDIKYEYTYDEDIRIKKSATLFAN